MPTALVAPACGLPSSVSAPAEGRRRNVSSAPDYAQRWQRVISNSPQRVRPANQAGEVSNLDAWKHSGILSKPRSQRTSFLSASSNAFVLACLSSAFQLGRTQRGSFKADDFVPTTPAWATAPACAAAHIAPTL